MSVVDAEDLAAWEELEAQYAVDMAHKAVRVRVLGYLELCARRCEHAALELDRHVTLLLRARTNADRALRVMQTELGEVEEMARLVSIGDPEILLRLAEALSTFEADE